MYQIHQATNNQLHTILAWLEDEENAFRNGDIQDRGFYCNRNIIESAQQEDNLFVASQDGKTIAFAALAPEFADINLLEVHPDHRGKGAGSSLAKFCIQHFHSQGACFVEVECQPSSSEQFWRSKGFKLLPERHSLGGAIGLLELTFFYSLSSDWEPVDIKIRAYDDLAFYSNVEPKKHLCEWLPNAAKDSIGIIHLDRRVSFHNEFLKPGYRGDIFIEIIAGEKTVLSTKAKYDTAKELGVASCKMSGAHFIERINLSST